MTSLRLVSTDLLRLALSFTPPLAAESKIASDVHLR
jgi:hypothetical protein